jgi:hypothetical protein
MGLLAFRYAIENDLQFSFLCMKIIYSSLFLLPKRKRWLLILMLLRMSKGLVFLVGWVAPSPLEIKPLSHCARKEPSIKTGPVESHILKKESYTMVNVQICREKDKHPQLWEDVHHIDGSLWFSFDETTGSEQSTWCPGLYWLNKSS